MFHTEEVQKALQAHSETNVDDYVKVDSFHDEVVEVSETSLAFELR